MIHDNVNCDNFGFQMLSDAFNIYVLPAAQWTAESIDSGR